MWTRKEMQQRNKRAQKTDQYVRNNQAQQGLRILAVFWAQLGRSLFCYPFSRTWSVNSSIDLQAIHNRETHCKNNGWLMIHFKPHFRLVWMLYKALRRHGHFTYHHVEFSKRRHMTFRKCQDEYMDELSTFCWSGFLFRFGKTILDRVVVQKQDGNREMRLHTFHYSEDLTLHTVYLCPVYTKIKSLLHSIF